MTKLSSKLKIALISLLIVIIAVAKPIVEYIFENKESKNYPLTIIIYNNNVYGGNSTFNINEQKRELPEQPNDSNKSP